MIQPDHFEDLGHVDADFAIQHTQLCIIISQTMRRRWALRASVQERIEATEHADETLAKFIQQLPPSLQPSLGYPNIWQACLHLTYNSFLLLLHRPPPRPDLNDALSKACSSPDICADSSALLATLLESLHTHGGLRSLCFFGVHTIFTALVFIKSQLCSSNPLVVAKAARSFRSLSVALFNLSSSWSFAKGLSRWTKGMEDRMGPVERQQQLADISAVEGSDANTNGSNEKSGPAFQLASSKERRATRSTANARIEQLPADLPPQQSDVATEAQSNNQGGANRSINSYFENTSGLGPFDLDGQSGSMNFANMLDDPLFTSIPLLDGFMFGWDDGNSYVL